MLKDEFVEFNLANQHPAQGSACHPFQKRFAAFETEAQGRRHGKVQEVLSILDSINELEQLTDGQRRIGDRYVDFPAQDRGLALQGLATDVSLDVANTLSRRRL